MERRKGSWYERQEIQKVTLDWVRANCGVTQREIEILELIYDRKLVRRDHLEIISESYRKLSGKRTLVLNKSIRKMYRSMILDKIHEKRKIGKGNTPCIVSVDKGGSLILNVPHKRRISHKKIIFKGENYIERSLPLNYRHINGINQLEVDTILFCDETGNSIVTWKHEYGREFYYNGEKILFIPDVFVEMDLNNKKFLAFIEYDTGSENHRNKNNFPIIYDKLINYRRYRSSKLWEKEFKYFPIVMLVTEDEKRIEYFNNKCVELGLQGFGIYYENYRKVLERLVV